MKASSFFVIITFSIATIILTVLGEMFLLGLWNVICDRLAVIGFISLYISFVITLTQAEKSNDEIPEDTNGTESDS